MEIVVTLQFFRTQTIIVSNHPSISRFYLLEKCNLKIKFENNSRIIHMSMNLEITYVR